MEGRRRGLARVGGAATPTAPIARPCTCASGRSCATSGAIAQGAAASFRRAAELDPLGEGTRALVALHDSVGDYGGALGTVDHEVADVRRALAADPLDVRRLEKLRELLEMARSPRLDRADRRGARPRSRACSIW